MFALEIKNVSHFFENFCALNDISIKIKPGDFTVLLGLNGAGKTTLMDVITGKTHPDKGHIYFGQTIDLLGKAETEIAQLGIGRKFQNWSR